MSGARARLCGCSARTSFVDVFADEDACGGAGSGGLVVARESPCGTYGTCAPSASVAVGGGGVFPEPLRAGAPAFAELWRRPR